MCVGDETICGTMRTIMMLMCTFNTINYLVYKCSTTLAMSVVTLHNTSQHQNDTCLLVTE